MQPRPDESAPTDERAACTDDDVRVRELAEALQRERAERLRLEQTAQEARTILHALNNVLSVVTTCAVDLSDEVEPGHAARTSVDEIAEAARRAGALARKLGDLHRIATRGEPSGHGRA